MHVNSRAGCRERSWGTRAASVEPSFLSSKLIKAAISEFLEPRRTEQGGELLNRSFGERSRPYLSSRLNRRRATAAQKPPPCAFSGVSELLPLTPASEFALEGLS